MMKSILFFSFILFSSHVMFSQTNNTITSTDPNELALVEINQLTEALQLTAEQNEQLQIIVMGIVRKNSQVQLMDNLSQSEIDNIIIQNGDAKIRMIKGILEGKQVGLYENLLTTPPSDDSNN